MIRRWLAPVAIMLSAATAAAAPLGTTTDAERTWREVRGSDDVKTKRMAERWYGAIKLQEWGDASGKFTTTAKYVEHDPKLAWVKLRVIQGVGDTRVVKDVTIPLDKLSKSCQARVRTISVLSEKIAEAIAEEQEQAVEEETQGGDRGGEMRGEQALAEDPRGGRGQYDAGLAGMDAEQALAEGSDPRESRDPRQSRDPRTSLPTESPASSDPAGVSVGVSTDPLPAVLPPLPAGTAQAADGPSPGETTASDQPARPNFPDNDPWRTSYDAFRANFSVRQVGRDEYQIDWGQFDALRQACELSRKLQKDKSTDPASYEQLASLFESVGEFTWESTLTEANVGEDNSWTERLGLPPLPEPLFLDLVIDEERGAGNWQHLKAGDRIRFTGRFVAFEDEHILIAAIRFPEEASTNGRDQRPAETDPRAAAARPQDDRGR